MRKRRVTLPLIAATLMLLAAAAFGPASPREGRRSGGIQGDGRS